MLKRKKVWIIAAALCVAGAAGFLFWHNAAQLQAAGDFATYRVTRGPLTISVIQSGTIQAREMTTIQNQLEGRTSILWLIQEGTEVQKGDLVMELDASSLIDSRLDQEIRLQNAEASYIRAQENLEVVRNQAQSDVELATLQYEFAQEDLDQYIDGEYPNELMRSEASITLAEEELARARERLEWSRTLFDEKFISQTEMQADELNEKRRTLDLERAENDYNLLTEFTYKRKLAQLESDLRQAEMALERTKRRARADVVQAEAELKARELEYNRQRDRLQKIEEQIVNATIYAPTAGTVIYATSAMTGGRRWNVEPLTEGRDVREREDLIYLPTTASAKAEVGIHEANLQKIRVGLPAVVTVDALPGRKYLATVASIAPLPDAQSMFLNPDLKLYNTEVFLEDNDEALRTGMSCNVEIIAEQHDDVLSVPVQSVIRADGAHTVFVVNGRSIEPRQVEIGMDNNRMVHIRSGLSEGEQVLLTPPLSAGTADGRRSRTPAEPGDIDDRVRDRLNNNDRSADAPAEPPQAAPEAADPMQQLRQRLEQMTPEQREQLRQQYEQMSPEQQEQLRRQMRPEGSGSGQRQGQGQGQRRQQRPAETTP